jgi:hypothetical protein
MKTYVSSIFSNNLFEAKRILHERINEIVKEKLEELKLEIASEPYDIEEELDELDEGNVQKMGRVKLVKIRIRKGKVQRRKKLSTIKGYTIRGGKVTRMPQSERLNRRMAQRRAKLKRRGKLGLALRKRKMSIRKRGAMGLQ